MQQSLLDVKAILDTHKITFWLAFGTFLGAYRDKALIPWDSDADLAICSEDAPLLIDTYADFVRLGFQINICPDFFNPEAIALVKEGTKIDILSFELIGDKRVRKFCQYDAKDFEEYNDVDFLGTKWRIVSNPEKWLKYTYGDLWRIPKVNKGPICTGYDYTTRDLLEIKEKLEITKENLILIEEHLVNYGAETWLAFGTFLGAYRDGALIPYDKDAEVAIYAEDLPKAKEGISQLLSNKEWGFKVRDDGDAILLQRKWRFTWVIAFRSEGDKRVWRGLEFDAEDFEKFNDIKFLGKQWRILNNPEKWLKYTYGEDWNIPIEQKSIGDIWESTDKIY